MRSTFPRIAPAPRPLRAVPGVAAARGRGKQEFVWHAHVLGLTPQAMYGRPLRGLEFAWHAHVLGLTPSLYYISRKSMKNKEFRQETGCEIDHIMFT